MPQGESDPDRREREADAREAALDVREDRIRGQEALSADRSRQAQAILDDAAARDGQADARDSRATARDKAASLQSFLHDDDFSPGVNARHAAGMDRSHSREDRISAADDRSRLTADRNPHMTLKNGEDGEE